MQDDSTVGSVYFIQGQVTRLVKIGYSANVAKRMEAFRCHSAEEIVLLATVAGDERLERALHAAFSQARRRGEWFEMSSELLALIVSLQESAPSVQIERSEPRPRLRRPSGLGERIWDALNEPKTIVELALVLGSKADIIRMTMCRQPERFARCGVRPVSKGRPEHIWGRVGQTG